METIRDVVIRIRTEQIPSTLKVPGLSGTGTGTGGGAGAAGINYDTRTIQQFVAAMSIANNITNTTTQSLAMSGTVMTQQAAKWQEATGRIGESMSRVVSGAADLARGYALASAATEEDTVRVLKNIVAYESWIRTLTGVIDVGRGVVATYQAIAAASALATAATAASTASGASSGVAGAAAGGAAGVAGGGLLARLGAVPIVDALGSATAIGGLGLAGAEAVQAARGQEGPVSAIAGLVSASWHQSQSDMDTDVAERRYARRRYGNSQADAARTAQFQNLTAKDSIANETKRQAATNEARQVKFEWAAGSPYGDLTTATDELQKQIGRPENNDAQNETIQQRIAFLREEFQATKQVADLEIDRAHAGQEVNLGADRVNQAKSRLTDVEAQSAKDPAGTYHALAAAQQELTDATAKQVQLERDYVTASQQAVIGQQAVAQTIKDQLVTTQMQIKAQRDATLTTKARFAQMNPLERQRLVSIDKDLKEGKELTRSNAEFLERTGFGGKAALGFREKEADASGFGGLSDSFTGLDSKRKELLENQQKSLEGLADLANQAAEENKKVQEEAAERLEAAINLMGQESVKALDRAADASANAANAMRLGQMNGR